MDYINTVTAKRVQYVLREENTIQSSLWEQHNSFVYCELAQANQQLVDEIMEAAQPSQLQKIWTMLQEKGFLSYKVTPKMINEHAEEFADLSLDDQKRFLIECLDKNMLYIPFADMDDSAFTLSDNEKLLTRQFYARR